MKLLPLGRKAQPIVSAEGIVLSSFQGFVPSLEASRYSIYLLHAFGIALIVARLVHGLALSFGSPKSGRFVGTALTFVVLLIEAVLCIYQGFRGQWIWMQ